jgi:hypothetical protein
MRPFTRHLIISLLFSSLLFSSTLVIMIRSAGSLLDSIRFFRRFEEWKGSPQRLKLEMAALANRKVALQARINRLNSMRYPSLDLLSSFASRNGLILKDVDCQEIKDRDTDSGRWYRLTFGGDISHALDALYLIERNFIVDIESIIIRPCHTDTKRIDLILSVRLRE